MTGLLIRIAIVGAVWAWGIIMFCVGIAAGLTGLYLVVPMTIALLFGNWGGE